MSKREALVATLLSAGLLAWLAPFASLGVDMHHDGIILKPALDVLSGQVLFRDTFSQYGSLSCYLQVVALWLQPSLLSVRFMMVGAYALALFFLYASWRLILPRSLTVLSGALFILFIPAYEKNWLDQYWMLLPWSSVFALMFQGAGLYALFRVVRGEQPLRWGLILGAVSACVFWCRQPVGITMIGSLVVIWLALHWTGWRPAGRPARPVFFAITGGFVVVNALLLGRIVLSGALPEWWYQNFTWPRKWVLESVNVRWHDFVTVFVHPAEGAGLLLLLLAAAGPGLVKRFRPDLPARGGAWYYGCLGLVLIWQHDWLLHVLALREGGWTALLPLLVLFQLGHSFAGAFAGRNAGKTIEYYLVASLAVFSLASLPQYYPVPDSWHILWSLGPAFGLIVFVLWRWSGWPAPVLALVLAAAFLPSVWVKARSARTALGRPMVKLAEPAVLRGMEVPPAQARTIGQIMAVVQPVLQLQPDIPTALIGNDALYLCFGHNRTNPSPYFVTWIGLADNAENERHWANIQRVRPLLFLHKARWEAVGDFYRRARYVPLLYLPEDALEIAVPQELADALGVSAYGAAKAPPKP